MKPFVIATLSLCVALLCLALSLSQLAEEHNLPDPAMSSSATFHYFQVVCSGCYERAGQGSKVHPTFPRTRLLPFTFLAADCVRERQRVSRPSLWRTDHLAGPRIKRQEQWVGLDHGQCDPPPLRPLPPRQASHIVCYSNVVRPYRTKHSQYVVST